VATIEFYSGIADKGQYALRLLRKAQAKGARVAVVGEAAVLRRLDADLWTADARDFVPHVRVEGSSAASGRPKPLTAPLEGSEPSERAGRFPSGRMDRTPLWLVEDARLARGCAVLVNLGPEAVEAFDGFERVIELVSADAEDRKTGRARWRRYESMGHTIQHTPMDNQGPPTPDGGGPHADA
jgi:DNA polymerase-3 subunit chi